MNDWFLMTSIDSLINNNWIITIQITCIFIFIWSVFLNWRALQLRDKSVLSIALNILWVKMTENNYKKSLRHIIEGTIDLIAGSAGNQTNDLN